MHEEKKVHFGWKEFCLLCGSIIFVLVIFRMMDILLSFPYDYYLNKNFSLIFPLYSNEEFVSTDFRYRVSINSIGIRDKEISIPKQKDTFRIIVFGDSYTYGWGVDITDTWVRRLESKIQVEGKTVETVNLGKPGGDPIFYHELAKVAIPILEPDLILIALLQGDDLLAVCGSEISSKGESIFNETLHFIFPNIYKNVQRYFINKELVKQSKNKPALINSAEKNRESARNSAKEILEQFNEKEMERFNQLDEEIRTAFLNGLINPFLISIAVRSPEVTVIPLKDSSSPEIVPCIENLTRILDDINEMGRKAGARTVVVSIPQGFYVNRYAWENMKRLQFEVTSEMLTTENVDKHFVLSAERAFLPCIVLTEEFREQKENSNLFFPIDGHPTTEGHKLIADTLSKKIQKYIKNQ